MPAPAIHLGLDAVIVAVTAEAPRVLIVRGDGADDALPSGPLDLETHPTLERGVRDWVTQQTGLALGYVEQLYTFGDRFRDPRERAGGARVISMTYLALMREQALPAGLGAHWRDCYAFLPWEDWRRGRPELIARELAPRLHAWAAADTRKHERVDLTFGLDTAPWDPERTLERYELLWEAGLVAEACRDRAGSAASVPGSGAAMALDHRRILATALGRVRGKLKYRPVVFELLPAEFTLLQLQQVVEALSGNRLHKQNFRRLVESAGLVEGTGRLATGTGGRPAELFRFRHDVYRERPDPGVYFPGAWWSR
ncbi:hypothetical protein DFR29_11846 [Tahibacter aquaticus]|uniref:NrtR DNA-binding winged helix domain-containing protein n=1 Tax=Tahibacter aquaticus TaxID=520092 RepID=A0A4R6YN43_9GAMM|nr:hypothetical protein [Tahibacter aquaticus]TDR38903.1 hypothetical protein DFR29_11846 [Tahibacter aquaticus]